jgi:hypothetical protein
MLNSSSSSYKMCIASTTWCRSAFILPALFQSQAKYDVYSIVIPTVICIICYLMISIYLFIYTFIIYLTKFFFCSFTIQTLLP